MAFKFLEKGFDFVMNFIDSLFGDFISCEIYRLSGDIIQIKANIYYESQNISEAFRLFDKAFNYYRFAGQILLKKFHSKSLEDVDSNLEIKCEAVFSCLSITSMMQALCFESQFKFERMIEALSISHWINTKLLVYEFSEKLRSHVSELLSEAKSKYSLFLEEKGEIRRVLIQAFPDLELLEQKQSEQDSPSGMINNINEYLYNKGNVKNLNQTQFIIQKKQNQNPTITIQQEGQALMMSQENFDQTGGGGTYMNGQEYIQSGNNMSNRNLSQMGMASPERVKDVGSQSFTDMYNMNSLHGINNNNSTTTGLGNNTTNISNTNAHPTQFSYQNGYIRRTPSANMSSIHQGHSSPRVLSNQSLFNTTSGVLNQNSKIGHSLHQINEKDSVADYGINSKRPSNLQISTRETPINENRPSFRVSHSQSTRNANEKGKALFTSQHQSGMSIQKRYSSGNLVIRSNKATHEQPAPLYLREHNDQYKPKVLTTNKYFQQETYTSSTSKTLTDLKETGTSYQEQEKKFHYLNLLPIKHKLEKNQGVLSLDYAMENLIKEKIIQGEIKSIQQSLKYSSNNQQNNGMTGVNNSPFSSKMSSSQPNLVNPAQRISTHENAYIKSPMYSDIQMASLSPQSNLNLVEMNNQQLNKEKDIFCDKTVGQQIRNLMTSLNISPEDQIVIINDLESKFEAEKRSLFTSSKTNKSKVSQQGWTTDKILEELLKSINILGENVNTYNQRFYQFLSAIKDEDFDKSEFQTCLRKLQFRQRMGNGIIPSFFQERELPLARIQERRKIDDEYIVVQGGGERMVELMSDHKIIKNLFLDDGNTNDPAKGNSKDNQQGKDANVASGQDQNRPGNKQVQYSTAVSILGGEKRTSRILENKYSEDQKSDNQLKPSYKQKKKKPAPAKTSTLSEIPLFNTSDSNVEKFNMFGQQKTPKVDYFQKSQEALRQMVLKSEQDYEEMQKEIMNPKKNKVSSNKQTIMAFSNFTNKLAFSTSKYNQKEKIKKSGNKLDLIDFMRIQNKWRSKVLDKNGTIISTGTSEGGADSPISTLSVKFKKASRNFILANAMSSNSQFAQKNTIEGKNNF